MTGSAAASDATPTDPAAAGATSPDVEALYYQLVRITRSLRTGGPGTLTAGVASALWTIMSQGPMRMSELADREAVTMPTMSRIVATLEQQGFVERRPDPDDGRARQLVATDAGITVINTTQSRRAEILADALDQLDPQARDHLRHGLAALSEALTDPDQGAADALTAPNEAATRAARV